MAYNLLFIILIEVLSKYFFLKYNLKSLFCSYNFTIFLILLNNIKLALKKYNPYKHRL